MTRYIYEIKNAVNGKIYIGQTDNVKRRWKRYTTWRGKTTMPIMLAIRKHGIENFKFRIVVKCGDRIKSNAIEKKKIAENRSKGISYNVADGGLGGSYKGHCGHKQKVLTVEWRKNISNGCTGIKHPWKRETKERFVSPLIGRKLSAQHKENIRRGALNRWRRKT